MTKKEKPIIIHNEAELLAYLDHQIHGPCPTRRPIKFSKEMIEQVQWKPIKKEKKR